MYRKLTLPLFTALFITTLLLMGCNDEKEEYYERPEWLEPPIYQQLEEKGNFTNFLKLIDISGYTKTLSSAGYYTCFAPTDEAFSTYLTRKGITSINKIDTTLATNIVKYSLSYNAYMKDDIDDFQDNTTDTSLCYNVAFKRETAFYTWVYEDTIDGESQKVVDVNGVGELPGDLSYIASDKNNKHIPYFTDNFFSTKNLSAYDYNYFYPDKTFTGFNVCNAAVTEQDLRAENGVIHVIDEVIEPLPNLEDYLTSNSDYSVFLNLINEYMKDYQLAPTSIMEDYRDITGKSENVYIKYYNNLNFCPNCENFLKYATSGKTNDAQKDGWTLFAPNNVATEDFINNTLLDETRYKTLDELPSGLIAEFINAHLFRTTVWPSKFETTTNYYGEPARFDNETNIIEKKIGSNGFFYGTNIIQKTNAFYTVLGDIILDPQYSMYVEALNDLTLYDILKNPNFQFTVFPINNDMFKRIGITMDGTTGAWILTNEKLGTSPTVALTRIVKMNMFLNTAYKDFIGDKMIKTYDNEYVHMNNGMIYGSGNYHNGQIVYPKLKTTASNGIIYDINRGYKMPLYYSTEEIGYDIKFNIENYTKFFKYLEKADYSVSSDENVAGSIYNAEDETITGIENSEYNTLLIPIDSAIDGAVRDGYLPAITDLTFTQDELDMVSRFVSYHCLNGQIIVPGDEFSGEVRTLYTGEEGTVNVNVTSTDNDLIILDDYNQDVHIIYSKSNILSNNAVIHLTNNYLKYLK